MMDPADPEHLRACLEQHGALLGRQQSQLEAVAASIRDLAAQIQPLQLSHSASAAAQPTQPDQPDQPAQSAETSSSANPAREPRLPPPEKYSGEPGTCRSFLSQCTLIFELQPGTFPTDRAKVAYVITQLSGRAREWGTATWDAGSSVCGKFEEFAAEMKRVFDRSKHGHEAARELLHMRQGRRSVSDYAIDFQTLATTTGWSSGALFDTFLDGLSEDIKDELACQDLPKTCEELVNRAIRIDTRLQQRRRAKTFGGPPGRTFTSSAMPSSPSSSPTTAAPEPEPMQVDRTRLTPDERQRRITTRSCLYCGQPNHFVANCPLKASAHL